LIGGANGCGETMRVRLVEPILPLQNSDGLRSRKAQGDLGGDARIFGWGWGSCGPQICPQLGGLGYKGLDCAVRFFTHF